MKLIFAGLALVTAVSFASTVAAGPTKSTGGSTKSYPKAPTLSYNAQEAFNKTPDMGNVNYQDGKSGFDADVQCVTVVGSTVYFAAEVVRSTIYSVGTWIFVQATDNGEPSYNDTIGWMATDMQTALDACNNGTQTSLNYVSEGNITTK